MSIEEFHAKAQRGRRGAKTEQPALRLGVLFAPLREIFFEPSFSELSRLVSEGDSMKHNLFKLTAIFAIFLGLAVVGVQAQAPSKVEVNIPFEFSAGTKTLQPGVYSIKRLSGNYLALRNADGKSAVILNAPINLTSTDPNSAERVVFKKYGEQYYLSQIWLTVDTGRELAVRKKAGKQDLVEISLRMK